MARPPIFDCEAERVEERGLLPALTRAFESSTKGRSSGPT
jgi:hypothetical protein